MIGRRAGGVAVLMEGGDAPTKKPGQEGGSFGLGCNWGGRPWTSSVRLKTEALRLAMVWEKSSSAMSKEIHHS